MPLCLTPLTFSTHPSRSWPRHSYRLHEGRVGYIVGNSTELVETPVDEYSFLNRLRYSELNCTAGGGQYYPAADSFQEDCVFQFGTLSECPSWEVHGMGHSKDLDVGEGVTPVEAFTYIPFVNYSVMSDPCNDNWYTSR